jgi:hypothetical protein
MQEQTVSETPNNMRAYRDSRKRFCGLFALTVRPASVVMPAASCQDDAISRRPHQRGSLTTQQGLDATQVEEGLFRGVGRVS